MSRIDEALKRASGSPTAGSARQSDPFVSAWESSAEPAPKRESPDPPRRESVDLPRRESGEQTMTKSSAPILSRAEGRTLPTFSGKWKERLTASAECDPRLLEQFRKLAGTLHNAQLANGLRSILVTSSNPNEGKTMTAINLAVVLSESYSRRVLL